MLGRWVASSSQGSQTRGQQNLNGETGRGSGEQLGAIMETRWPSEALGGALGPNLQNNRVRKSHFLVTLIVTIFPTRLCSVPGHFFS